MRRALELYETAAVKTKKEAAEAVGLSRYCLHANNMGPAAQAYAASVDTAIQQRVVDLSAIIERVSEKALTRLEHLIDLADKDEVKLRAAQDILDRNPRTSKTSRLQVSSLSLTGKDVQALVTAITSGRDLKAEFPDAASGDYTPALEGTDVSVG